MKITNKLNLPKPFVDAVTSEYQYKPKRYSVTALLKGTCQTILERRHTDEIECDVSDMIWMVFGSAVHKIMEQSKETENQLKENWLSVDVNGYELSGIFDLYDDKEKKVTDYKTATVWKVIHDDWEDYRKQLLMYAWMLRKIGFECDKGEIVAMLKDHSKSKAQFDYSYPQYPVYVKSFKFSEKDFEEIEKFILMKFIDISDEEEKHDWELTPCNAEERWYSGDKYAVMKKGRKTALRVVNTEQEAKDYMQWKGVTEKDHYIEYRAGENKKCNDYCSVKEWCPLFNKKKEEEND